MSSTIPAFKAALLARLEQIPASTWGGDQPTVARHDTQPDEPGPLIVLIKGATPGDPTGGNYGSGQQTASFGRLGREERYVVEVDTIAVGAATATAPEVEQQAYALAAVIEDSVRAWAHETPSFGGVVRWCLVTGLGDEAYRAPGGRAARVTIDLAVAARIY